MALQTGYLIFMATNLAVLSSGCAAGLSEPIAPGSAPVRCRGGTLHSEADAAAYSLCDSVIGDLRVRQSSLTSLDALAKLSHVSGTLEISGNPQLEDLRGLARLTTVAALDVRDNPQLDDLKGLEGLRRVGSVNIEHNGIYDSVGLGNLQEVGTLVVKDNPKLISLRGLKRLARAHSVEIRNNRLLAAYYGLLPELQSVQHQLVLRHNSGLSQREVSDVLDRVERGSQRPTVVARDAQHQVSSR